MLNALLLRLQPLANRYGLELDKLGHFLAGALAALVALLLGGSPILAVAVAALAGLLKELYDFQHPDKHTVDFADLWWTTCGGSVVAIARAIWLTL